MSAARPAFACALSLGLLSWLPPVVHAQQDQEPSYRNPSERIGDLSGQSPAQLANQAGDLAENASAVAEVAQNIQVEALETAFDENLGVARATGNVITTYGGTIIEAATAEYHQSTGDIFARDDVVIYKDGGIFLADEAIYNVNTGEMTAVRLDSSLKPIFYKGSEIQLPTDSDAPFDVDGARFTTHDSEDPNWNIKAKTVRIVPNDRVIFKSMTVYAGKVPVMWLPYLSQPLDDELGYFFTPGYNSGWGAFILNRYGFMIGDHTLATANLDLRSSRGVAGGIEFESQRHRNNDNFGRLNIYYAYDSEPNQTYGGVDRLTDLDENRYRVNFQHRVYLPGPEKSTHYLDFDINKLSDAFFYADYFPNEYTIDPQPDNLINLVKHHPRGTLSLMGRFQLNEFFRTDTRLPEIALDMPRQPIFDTGLFYNGYTTFGILDEELGDEKDILIGSRNQTRNILNAFDRGDLVVNRNGDLVTQEGGLVRPDFDEAALRSDLLSLDNRLGDRAFNRFDTYHEILYPHTFGDWLTVVPRAGVGYTNYSSVDASQGGSWDRVTLHAGIDASTKFSRVYSGAQSEALGIDELRHIIQPYVNYSFVSTDEPLDSFRGIDRLTPSTRLRPIDVPMFTSVDSLRDWSVLRTGVFNRFQTKRNGGTYNYFDWNLFFDTYFEDPEFDRDFSNLFNEFTWYPLPWLTASLDSQVPGFNNKDPSFYEVNSQLTFMPWKNFRFSLGYYMLQDHPFFRDSNLVTLATYTRLSDNWGFSTVHRFEADDSTLEVQQYQLHRDLSSWTASFGGVIRDNRNGEDEFGLVLSLTLKAFPQVSLPVDLEPGGLGQ